MSVISKLAALAAAGAGGETEQYVAIACSGTVSDLRNSLVVIPFNKNDGFGTYQNIPAGSTAPPNRPATQGQVGWSGDGGAIVFTHFDSPLVSAYAFAGGALGAKYSNPSSLPSGSSATGLAFSNSGSFVSLASNTSSNNFYTYQWSDSSGFGARYTSNFLGGQEAKGIAWSNTDNWIGTVSNRAKVIKWTGSGYGTEEDTAVNVSGQYRVSWNSAGDHVMFSAVTATATQRLLIYTWNDVTGLGTNVSPSFSFYPYDAQFSPDDKAIVVATNTYPYVKAFAWDNATSTLGSELSSTASPASATGTNVAFNTAGDVVFLGVNNAKLMNAYEFDSTTGFGSKYADPVLTGFPTSGPTCAGIAYKDFG